MIIQTLIDYARHMKTARPMANTNVKKGYCTNYENEEFITHADCKHRMRPTD